MRLALLVLALLAAACSEPPTQPRACVAPADTAWQRVPLVSPQWGDTVWMKIAVLPC